jgi:hypothetical protein
VFEGFERDDRRPFSQGKPVSVRIERPATRRRKGLQGIKAGEHELA